MYTLFLFIFACDALNRRIFFRLRRAKQGVHVDFFSRLRRAKQEDFFFSCGALKKEVYTFLFFSPACLTGRCIFFYACGALNREVYTLIFFRLRSAKQEDFFFSPAAR